MKKTMKVTIKGVKPLLFHAFRESALDRKKTKEGTTGNNPNEWKDTMIVDEERKIYLPADYLFSCIKKGGKYSKIGRGNIIEHVAASLLVLPDKIYIKDRSAPDEDKITKDPTQPVYIDMRAVVNPMTKGRNLRYRLACSPPWECEFFVTWEDNILSKNQMQQVIRDGGLMSGVGCGRAIGMGRFEVVEFSEK